MQITVIDVGQMQTQTGKNGRSYQFLEITYKNEQGQAQSKKLMSFGNPAVFKAAQTWQKGDTVDIMSEKDDNGYWQWTGLGKQDPTLSKPATKVTQGAETDRQIMIIRQSSLSNAVATLATHGTKLNAADVVALAQTYEHFVLHGSLGSATTEASDEAFSELADDVPF
jgi:hypothetical protein